jgi:RNA-directed DNA polymerase
MDEQTIADFERDMKNNLYRVWNRMSSGSYFPPPVRTVKIPKAGGGERPLGIPTVSDRVAQMVVKNRLEPLVDPLFQADSYGYRPKKSALDAVGRARQMCWAYERESSSAVSVRLSRRRRYRESVTRSEAGSCIGVQQTPSKISQRC